MDMFELSSRNVCMGPPRAPPGPPWGVRVGPRGLPGDPHKILEDFAGVPGGLLGDPAATLGAPWGPSPSFPGAPGRASGPPPGDPHKILEDFAGVPGGLSSDLHTFIQPFALTCGNVYRYICTYMGLNVT